MMPTLHTTVSNTHQLTWGMIKMIEVTYIDHMGSDLSVVNAARVSFGKESLWQLVHKELDSGTRGWHRITQGNVTPS